LAPSRHLRQRRELKSIRGALALWVKGIKDRFSREQPDVTPRVTLAAFGKHPGWDDHIDDIGLETDRLVAIKRQLYIQGVGGNVEKGAWDNLDQDQRLDGFGHQFLWYSPGCMVAGRFWSSRDGKGRSRYPMIVCAQCDHLSLPWVEQHVLPRLESLEAQCKAVATAGEVVHAVGEVQADLSNMAAREAPVPAAAEPSAQAPAPGPVAQPRALAALHERLEADGHSQESLWRILYQIEPWTTARTPAGSDSGISARALHLRVPDCGMPLAEAAGLWLGFLLSESPMGLTALLIKPDNRSWLDVVIGEPTTAELYCIRAGLEAIPLTSAIPYNLDEQFIERAEKRLADSAQGLPTPAQTAAAQATTPALAGAASGAERLARTLRSRKTWIVIAAAVGVLVILLLAVRLVSCALSTDAGARTAPQTNVLAGPEFEAEDWESLCDHYDDWLGLFLGSLGQKSVTGESREKFYSADKALDDGLGKLVPPCKRIDPHRMAIELGCSRKSVRDDAPEDARTAKGIAATKAALEAIDKFVVELHGWSSLQEITDAADRYTQDPRQWYRPAAYLRSVVKTAKAAPYGDVAMAKAIDQVLAAKTLVAEIQALNADIEGKRQIIEKTQDSVLSRFGQFVTEQTKSESQSGQGSYDDLSQLRNKLKDIKETTASDLATFVLGDWDSEVNKNEAAAAEPCLAEGEVPGPENFNQWRLVWVKQFYRLRPDPRDELVWKDKLEDLSADLALLAQHEKATQEVCEDLTARLQKVRQDVDRMLAIVPIAKNKTEIDEAKAAAKDSIRAFARDTLNERRLLTGEPKEWLAATLSQQSISSSKAIDAQWVRYRDELLQGVTAEELLATRTEFNRWCNTLRPAVSDLETRLAKLDEELLADVPAQPRTGARGRIIHDHREDTLAEALAQLPFVNNVPTPDANFAEQWQTLRDAYKAWSAESAKLLNEFDDIRTTLDTSFVGDIKSIRDRHDKWAERDVYRKFKEVLTPVVQRIDRLTEIDSLNDRRKLLETITGAAGDRPEQVIAAWLQLGELDPPWPAGVDQLQEESVGRAKVKARADAINDGGARESLERMLAEQGRHRWSVCVKALDSAGDLGVAFGMMEQFGVDVQKLDPAVRFNLLLHQQLRTADADQEDEKLIGQINAFIAEADKLGDVAGTKDAAALLGDLRDLVSKGSTGRAVDPSKVGPGVAGWRGAVDKNSDSITYSWPPGPSVKHTLTFVRVEPEDRDKLPVYLCTTEVSVALVRDIVAASGKAGVFNAFLRGYDPSREADPRTGPRTWEWKEYSKPGQTIRPSGTWLFTVIGDDRELHDASLDPGKPAGEHPMQYVSPHAAVFFTWLVGCRLPTADEWEAARAIRLADADPSQWNQWNLRDKTWRKQWEHMNDRVTKGKGRDWPDADIFWPDSADEASRKDADEAEVLSTDDGQLWFALVDADRGHVFHHLLGNVAELVCNLSHPVTPQDADAQTLARFFDESKPTFHVIGGSAMSPPQGDLAEALPLNVDAAKDGYSDVGFRLAFTTPQESLASKLRRILAKTPPIPMPSTRH